MRLVRRWITSPPQPHTVCAHTHTCALPQRFARAQHAAVAMGNVAKGFTSRIATTTSPRVGEILGSGLDPALRCVQLWPRDALTRQRVVAYFQRLVTTTGARVSFF